LIDKLDAVESLSRDFEFTLDLLCDNATLALPDLLGKLLCVALVRKDGRLRYFTGYCFALRLLGTDGGLARYEAKLGPWLKYLSLRKNNVLFQGKTLREQAEQIFRAYAPHADWEWRIRSTDAPMTEACQFDETDFNYLSRRWEAAGWHYFYAHTATGHKLIVSDDSTQAVAFDDDPEIRLQHDGGAEEEDAIAAWSPVRQIMPAAVALASFDFKRPVPACVSVPTLNRQGAALATESYAYAGAYGFKSQQDGDRLGRLRMEALEAAAQRFDGQGNNRAVCPGRWFRLSEHFAGAPCGRPDSNEFLIVQVHHIATNNYLAHTGPAPYRNSLSGIRRHLPWRPARHFNSTDTRILAPQTATVVGPAGQHGIHTDGYGRVRVQFHWDRTGNNDDKSSAWIRVASNWAGAHLGAVALPRVGAEVIVHWLDGNPDRPIIIGSVYNECHLPPWPLPAQQALTGLRSRELMPDGDQTASSRGNHLILDDTPTQLQAQLKSDHQHSQLTLGRITGIDDHRQRRDARGEGWELATQAWGVARAHKGMLLTTEAQPDAASPVKNMKETVRRLRQAHERHEALAAAAQQSGAQQGQQSEVAHALQAHTDAIEGSLGGAERFPELAAPHLVLASAAGMHTTAAQSTHIASARHTALSTGEHLSIASGHSLLASIGHTLRLFVQRAGMKLIAAAGDIDLQALRDGIRLLARLDITQSAHRITITAREEVVINGGGSYARFHAGGIEHGTLGPYVAHAATHGFPGAKSWPLPQMPHMPMTTEAAGYSQRIDASQLLTHWIGHAQKWANVPFEAYNEQSELIHVGMTDQHAATPSIYTNTEQELTIAFDVDDWHIEIEEELPEADDDKIEPLLDNQNERPA
jgi:type VI secretion system secreted protein VgrG